jgi:lysophospholipase L1-like esterase
MTQGAVILRGLARSARFEVATRRAGRSPSAISKSDGGGRHRVSLRRRVTRRNLTESAFFSQMGRVHMLKRLSDLARLGALLISSVACSGEDGGANGTTGTSGGPGAMSGSGGTSASGGSGGSGAGANGAGASGGTGTDGGTGNGGGANGGRENGGGANGGGDGGDGSVTTGGIRWVGRVDASDPSAVKFAWQGAGFIANVSGTTLKVKLEVHEGTSTVYFQPVIDGTPGERFNVDPGATVEVTLATGLEDKVHTVELYRETEGIYGVSSFLGFTEGTPTSAPPASDRFIEVVGDSISAGYGNLGVEYHPGWVANPACTWTAENSSWYVTYAARAGRALGAEVSSVALSGWGMTRDRDGGDRVLPKVFENALGTDDPTPWHFERKASAVVVNLGTNDWALGDPGTAYETAYVAFIGTVREHYPDAYIFLTIGSMLGASEVAQVKARLMNVKSATGDDKIVVFDFGTQNLGSNGEIPSGCDWHPSRDEHARMAGILQQRLAETLGW